MHLDLEIRAEESNLSFLCNIMIVAVNSSSFFPLGSESEKQAKSLDAACQRGMSETLGPMMRRSLDISIDV